MRISRKRSKKSFGRFLGAILGICLLTGCGGTAGQPAAGSSEPAEEADYSAFYGMKVAAMDNAALYRKDDRGNYQSCGSAASGSLYDIDSEDAGAYVHIADSSFYLRGDSVEDSKRWFRNGTNLMPSGRALTTADSYTVQDVKGNAVMLVSSSDTYDIYVMPIDSDDRYGVRIQNDICYIPAEDVKETSSSGSVPSDTAAQVPVLMYHFFYSENDGGTRKDGNYVEVGEFDEQLRYLKENNRPALTMRELLYFLQGRASVPKGSVAITIDDGDPTIHQYAYPLLKQYQMHATIFLITGWEDPTLSWDNWEMREDGIELQSHGFLTHQGGCSGMGHGGKLLCMDYKEAVEDTVRSFDYVDGGFVYCYPFGDYDSRAESIIKDAGGLMAFTVDGGLVYPGIDMYALPRVRVHGGNGIERFAQSISVS